MWLSPVKRVIVTGDWVADWNLAQPEDLPDGYFDGTTTTQLTHRAGGAWYLADLIERVACRDLVGTAPVAGLPQLIVRPARPRDESLPRHMRDDAIPPDAAADRVGRAVRPRHKRDDAIPPDLADAYSVWWKHKRLESGKDEDKVWRIGRFAGCRRSGPWLPDRDDEAADFLVIDDLNLGFSAPVVPPNEDPLKRAVDSVSANALVVLKHGVQPSSGGVLPRLLRHEGDIAGRLHVVLSASSLRQRNAALSRALSWDQALEDIEKEFRSGPSSRDLKRVERVVVHFGLAGAAVFKKGELDRFVFLPDELEGAWDDERPGRSFGAASVLTAALVRHLADPDGYPIFIAISQALAAQRAAHHEGGGSGRELDIDYAFGARAEPGGAAATGKLAPAAALIRPPLPGDDEKDKADKAHLDAIAPFRAAWNPQSHRVWPRATAKSLARSRLLCNITGTTPESLQAKAAEVVIHGVAAALGSVPKASYGRYKTVDREEIESINEVRRLILEYRHNPGDRRPLSLAVFGAPGSGKSFAIKEIGKEIFGKDKVPLEFNLTQLKSPDDLHRAFHQVRDASIRHEIPLVFWDEFDTDGLKWLADFLAPMQDHEFFDGSHKHPFGKCIFVFAGATCGTFAEFKRWGRADDSRRPDEHDAWSPGFRAVKGPDFVSRLRGFVNVKGPNPGSPHPGATPAERIEHDPAYVLRRAMVLRSEIQTGFKDLIDADTKQLRIAPNVLHALLTVERYEHGARSLGAMLAMSGLGRTKVFNTSALPSRDLWSLHVSKDFRGRLAAPGWSEDLVLALARAAHEGYRKERLKTEPGHKDLVPWEQLNERQRIDNLDPVRRRLLVLVGLGYEVVPRAAAPAAAAAWSPIVAAFLKARVKRTIIGQMVEPEHRIWLSRRLSDGWEYSPEMRRHVRQSTDIRAFQTLPAPQKRINLAIIQATLDAFEAAGYSLVRA